MFRPWQQRTLTTRLYENTLHPTTFTKNRRGVQRQLENRIRYTGRRPAIFDREYLEFTERVEWYRWSIRAGVDTMEQARAVGTLELCLVNQRRSECPYEAWKCRWGLLSNTLWFVIKFLAQKKYRIKLLVDKGIPCTEISQFLPNKFYLLVTL